MRLTYEWKSQIKNNTKRNKNPTEKILRSSYRYYCICSLVIYSLEKQETLYIYIYIHRMDLFFYNMVRYTWTCVCDCVCCLSFRWIPLRDRGLLAVLYVAVWTGEGNGVLSQLIWVNVCPTLRSPPMHFISPSASFGEIGVDRR